MSQKELHQVILGVGKPFKLKDKQTGVEKELCELVIGEPFFDDRGVGYQVAEKKRWVDPSLIINAFGSYEKTFMAPCIVACNTSGRIMSITPLK